MIFDPNFPAFILNLICPGGSVHFPAVFAAGVLIVWFSNACYKTKTKPITFPSFFFFRWPVFALRFSELFFPGVTFDLIGRLKSFLL